MFTIPKAKRKSQITTVINQDIPGPGNYNVNNSFISAYQPSNLCKFSQQKREYKQSTPCGPGAGKYLPKLLGKQTPSYHIAQRYKSTVKNQSLIPGPGSYQPANIINNSPAFSIPKAQDNSLSLTSRSSQSAHHSPGPGAYEVNLTSIDKKSAHFGQSKRTIKKINDIPGVGSYNQFQNYLYDTPAYTFGKQQKKNYVETQIKNSNKIPGPGQYQVNKSYLSQSGGVILGKYNSLYSDILKSTTPGPAHYQQSQIQYVKSVNTSFSKSPRKSISLSPCDSSRKEISPGPNQYKLDNYNIIKPKNPCYNFPQAKRKQKLVINSNFPAPNKYTISINQQGPKYTIRSRGRPSQEFITDNPSPSQYNPNLQNIKKKSPQPFIVQSEKKCYFNEIKQHSVSPGPGAYTIQYNCFDNNNHCYTFNKQNKSIQKENNSSPGPGYYNVPNDLQDIPKYLLPPKLKIGLQQYQF